MVERAEFWRDVIAAIGEPVPAPPPRLPQPIKIWLSISEASRALGMHANSIKRIPPAELPYMRLGDRGDRKYHRNDIVAFIEKRMVRE